MRILYLHQYYKTPAHGGGIRSFHIGHALGAQGHEVHIITTWDGPVKRIQREGSLLITYLPIAYSNGMPKAARIRAFWAFVWESYLVARQSLPADRVFATSTPLTIGLVALLLKFKKGIPYVFEVRDCWPEAPIQLGYVKGGFYKAFLRWLERIIYRKANAVIALSEPMADHVRSKSPKTTIAVIPNFADISFFGEAAAQPSDMFHIVYAGTFGYANQVERLLRLALAAQNEQIPVRFTLAGDGADFEFARAFIQKHALGSSVRLLPHQSTMAVRLLLSQADAAYVGFRPEPILESNSPNKFFDALAAGAPILLGVQGWLAYEVRKTQCGVVLEDFPDDLAALQHFLAADKSAMRLASKVLARRFSKDLLVAHVVGVIEGTSPFGPKA